MQKSQEARIRALAHDLLAIVDRRDRNAMKQAAALATVPAKRPTGPDPRFTPNLAREVAYGRTVMPMLHLPVAAAREAALERRRELRALRADPGICPPWGTSVKIQEFEAEEKARFQNAANMLRNGVAEGSICIACDLEPTELEGIRAQLEGRVVED